MDAWGQSHAIILVRYRNWRSSEEQPDKKHAWDHLDGSWKQKEGSTRNEIGNETVNSTERIQKVIR